MASMSSACRTPKAPTFTRCMTTQRLPALTASCCTVPETNICGWLRQADSPSRVVLRVRQRTFTPSETPVHVAQMVRAAGGRGVRLRPTAGGAIHVRASWLCTARMRQKATCAAACSAQTRPGLARRNGARARGLAFATRRPASKVGHECEPRPQH